MTITTGAAFAPDDDGSPYPEDGDSEGSPEAGTYERAGSSHVFVPHVIGGISLTVAPDVVHEGLPTDPPPVGDDGSRVAPADLAPALEPPADQPNGDLPGEIASPLLSVIAVTTTGTPPAPPRVPLTERLRAVLSFHDPGLTGLGVMILGILVVGLGTTADLALGHGLGVGFTTTFLLGALIVAASVRTRSLAVAVVLPPLLFAGGYLLETTTSGQTPGRREMALDVATSLALHAPVLFVGTALAVAVTLGRLVVHVVRR